MIPVYREDPQDANQSSRAKSDIYLAISLNIPVKNSQFHREF
jgi:hypothetical protein